MQTIHNRANKGFTLLEILLVIAAIGILAAIVLVAINPNRQIAQARNAQRRSDVNTIYKALEQYNIDNQGYPTSIATGQYKEICAGSISEGCVDLSVLVPTYLAGIPTDPTGANYKVGINSGNNRISVFSELSENADIAVNKFTVPIGGQIYSFANKYNPNGWGNAITYLSDGSTVITGGFEGTATFGEAPGILQSLTSEGSNDIFIAKYNPDGSLAWAKKAGGAGWDNGYGITSLSDGSTVITGGFGETATFGEAPGTVQTLTSSEGSGDIFIAKYNPDGSLAWAKKAGGTSGDEAYGITSLSDGSTVITGRFEGTATFGEAPGTVQSLTSEGSYDIFIAKYNPDGSLAWAKKAGGPNDDYGYGITSLSDGSTVITGGFQETATFGEAPGTVQSLTSEGSNDIFIAKYNPDGSLAWAKKAGGSVYDEAYGIAIREDEQAFGIVGYTDGGLVTFGPGDPGEIVLDYGDDWGGFIAQYPIDGVLE